jgi:hypothetical protein
MEAFWMPLTSIYEDNQLDEDLNDIEITFVVESSDIVSEIALTIVIRAEV